MYIKYIFGAGRPGGFLGGVVVKKFTCQRRRHKRHGFSLWIWKIPWKGAWQSTLVFLPWKSHGQRSLKGYSPWDCKESDMIEELSMCAPRRGF